MKKQELLLLFVRSRLTLVQLLGDSKQLYCTMVVLLRRLAHWLLPLVFKTVEDCIPLLPVVSSKFLIEPGDGDALERSSSLSSSRTSSHTVTQALSLRTQRQEQSLVGRIPPSSFRRPS